MRDASAVGEEEDVDDLDDGLSVSDGVQSEADSEDASIWSEDAPLVFDDSIACDDCGVWREVRRERELDKTGGAREPSRLQPIHNPTSAEMFQTNYCNSKTKAHQSAKCVMPLLLSN